MENTSKFSTKKKGKSFSANSPGKEKKGIFSFGRITANCSLFFLTRKGKKSQKVSNTKTTTSSKKHHSISIEPNSKKTQGEDCYKPVYEFINFFVLFNLLKWS
jgi:hypothetical protein